MDDAFRADWNMCGCLSSRVVDELIIVLKKFGSIF